RSLSVLASLLLGTPPRATYTLSLHDALPICGARVAADGIHRAHDAGESRRSARQRLHPHRARERPADERHHLPTRDETGVAADRDRKSTRLNSSHVKISYAVFCLKKKKKKHR